MTISAGTDRPPGVILAGGRSRRMGGGDKGLLSLGVGTVLGAVIARLAPQVGALAINANGDPARFADFGLPVLADGVAGHAGPLAGVLVALDWAADLGAASVLTVPGDTPFLPGDLAQTLVAAAAGGRAAMACRDGRLHPTCAIWPVTLRPVLQAALARGEGRMTDFLTAQGAVAADFPANGPDPFFNINTPADLILARELP